MNFVGCPVTETITSELLPNQFNKKVLQCFFVCETRLQKGGVPAAPSGTATLLRLSPSYTPGFHGLTGGVYKARERIHRAMADARLLANPTSCRRVAACNPN